MADPKVPTSETPAQSKTALFKNLLQEYAQKAAIPLPSYETINEGTQHAPMFRSTVVINGATYTSPNVFLHRKSAEMDVARITLLSLAPQIKEENCSLDQEDNFLCKSILNEYAVKINAETPIFKTEILDGLPPAFVSSVAFNGKQYVGDEGRNKKESQQLAARAVILSILGADSDAHTDTVISKIINNSKKRLSAAKDNVNYPCATQNEVLPVGIQTESNVGTSASKGNKLKVVVNDSMARAAIPDSCTGNLTSVSAKPVPLNEFRIPEQEASLVEGLEAKGSPIIFMPRNAEQLAVDSAPAKKRKRKSEKAKNKVGIDAQEQIAALPSSVVNDNMMTRTTISEPCTGNYTSSSAKHVPLHEFRPSKEETSPVEPNNSPIFFMPPNSKKLTVESTSVKRRKHKSTKAKSKVGIDAQVQIAVPPSSVVVNDNMPRTAIPEPCIGNYTSVSAKPAPIHEFRLPQEAPSLVEANGILVIFMPLYSELAGGSKFVGKRKRKARKAKNKAKNKVGINAHRVQIAAVPSSVVVNDKMPVTANPEPCTGNFSSVSAKPVPLHEFRLPKEKATLVEAKCTPIIFVPQDSEQLVVGSTFGKKRKRKSERAKTKVGIDAQSRAPTPESWNSFSMENKRVQIAAVPSSQTSTCTVAQPVPNNCVPLQGESTSFDNAVSSGPCVQPILPKRGLGSETHIMIHWRKPAEGFIALNTDGAFQNGVAAGGGILRNHIGEHLSNFYNNYGGGSIDLAESKAILDGLSICKELGYNKIQIQTDSRHATLWFHRQIKIPLPLRTVWDEIYKFRDTLSIEIMHIFREANRLADYLSKKGIVAEGMGAINISLDKRAEEILTGEKLGISYLRRLKN